MALGTTNISTTLVGTTLGTSSRDVGTLCAGSSSKCHTLFSFHFIASYFSVHIKISFYH